ncbi:uncharacterized protein LOC119612484 isoform X2 [Lucilia sericata]|uniref:uncharacterized protein LOC119612484 isoform X2 n=1 Tax=Lucilia sericata TaxID=13632 RepID=UPI0018A82555|nr:uncharacterized protein LOC119612484 isoform X2 [Lucilia sericata]
MQQRNKFTGPFKNHVSFDKKEIRRKIIIPTFQQARRSADIYSALVQEFLEAGCPTSAKYFQILINKERILYENASIRERFLDEPKLLLSLFDNCKMAEKSALLGESNGPAICTRLLLQCILMFENYERKYDWILMDVFKIIIKIAAKVCEAEEVSKESLCRIYYNYGMYLSKSDLEEAVKYLEKSFDLAKGSDWIDEEHSNKGKIVHYSSAIAKRYGYALLHYANNIFHTELTKALSQAQKAIIILTGVGIEHNKSIYLKAHLDMAEFQIEAKNYEASLLILEKIIKYIKLYVKENDKYLKFLSRYHHLKGVCFERQQKFDMALIELHESLRIIHHLNLKQQEALVLLDIAKVYINRGRSQFRMAELCLRQAKEIFVTLNDSFNIKKTSYLMANLKMHNIQPMILDLIKFSSTNCCDKYRLTRWKSICLPFWRNLRHCLEQEERQPMHCHIVATEIPARNSQRRNFQRQAPRS